jgi:uncharacterized SAM-binding protein YcdF (DUF218 family)
VLVAGLNVAMYVLVVPTLDGVVDVAILSNGIAAVAIGTVCFLIGSTTFLFAYWVQNKRYQAVIIAVSSLIMLLFIALSVFSYMAWDFRNRLNSSLPQFDMPERAVVFTGKYERVWKGLELLENGEIESLFISGANRRSGVYKERFISQFSIEGELLEALSDGRIILGELGRDTFQNAKETACWLEGKNYTDPILLITSVSHMPRASYALEHEMPGGELWRLSVPETVTGEEMNNLLWQEFKKYLLTSVLSRVPARWRSIFEVRFEIRPQVECP